NGYYGMPMDPLDPYVQLVMGAPPSPDYIPGPEAPPSLDYISGPEYPEYLPPADDVLPVEEQPLPAAVSPTAESPGYIADLEPKMDPEEEDGDDEESEEDFIDNPTSRGDDDANDDGDELSDDDANDEDEEESSDREEEEEEHLAPTISAPALHSSIPVFEDSDETEPFEEGETAATPPPFGYRVTARISPLPIAVSPIAKSPGYIADSELEMDSEEEDGDDEKSKGDSIDYPTSRGGDDADDDGDDLLEDDVDDEDEEEFSDSEEEEEEHLAPTVPALALRSSNSASEDSDQTAPFEEGETAATPPPYAYPPLPRTPLLLPIPLPTSSLPLSLLLPSTSCRKGIPKADMPLRMKPCFTTPTGGYEVGESSVATARQIRPALTVDDSRRAEDRLIGRLRRERRYFHTLSTTYAQEVAHSCDYYTQIMDYCQSREVHTRTLVTHIETLQRDVSTLQGQHIDDGDRLMRHIQHKHVHRDAAPEDGDSCS
nr:hypothetical protein [Tanacetum cinerariifolium]